MTDLPLARDSRGSTFTGLLVMVDKFSKFTRIAPVFMGEGVLNARETARIFFEYIVRLFGVPYSILSDRDPRFTAELW